MDGTPSLTFSYVSKFLFGIGLAISVPIIAVAFAVDNIGLLIKRSLRSLVAWKGKARTPQRGEQSLRRQSNLDEGVVEDLKLGRRSGDTYRGRTSFEVESGSEGDVGLSPTTRIRYRTDRGWREKQDPRVSMRISRDLERGIGVV